MITFGICKAVWHFNVATNYNYETKVYTVMVNNSTTIK